MPIKDSEKRRAYDRERKRRKRAREKEAEVTEQISRGNINFGLKTRRTPFMSHEEYKRHFPNASFPTYLKEKIAFEKENQVRSVPKISREDAFKITGVDLWDSGRDEKAEKIRRHHEEADRLEAILNEPAHSNRPSEHTNFQEEIDKQVEQYYEKHPEDKPKKDEQEDSEEKQGNS